MSEEEKRAFAWAEQRASKRKTVIAFSDLVDAYMAGVAATCQACKELVVTGTTGCDCCNSGRVTTYQQGRYCAGCRT